MRIPSQQHAGDHTLWGQTQVVDSRFIEVRSLSLAKGVETNVFKSTLIEDTHVQQLTLQEDKYEQVHTVYLRFDSRSNIPDKSDNQMSNLAGDTSDIFYPNNTLEVTKLDKDRKWGVLILTLANSVHGGKKRTLSSAYSL